VKRFVNKEKIMAAPIVKKPPIKAMTPVPPKEEVTIAQIEEAEKPVAPPAPVAKIAVPKGKPAFDFAAYKAQKKAIGRPKPKPLMLLLTGKRGGGKSYSMGSCSGDALLLCSRQEHHSLDAALAYNAMLNSPHTITPMWMDMDDDGEIITDPDKVWDRVMDRLEALINTPMVELIFPFLCFDGITSIDRYVQNKKNVNAATQYQKSNEATLTLIKLIIDKFLRLREKGIHIICTIASEVKEKSDGTISINPKLIGYQAADEILGAFPDIGLATSIKEEDEEGNTKNVHVFQFKNVEVTKSGKKFSGESVTSTFNMRLQAIPSEHLPTYLEPNIGNLITFINETFESLSAQVDTKTEEIVG
jgi:hypothetical protein